jgi:probable HAF family extracellular repeat protein
MTDIGTLGGAESGAHSINANGQVVGWWSQNPSAITTRAFIWDRVGGMHDLGTLGGAASDAVAINSSGQVAGWASESWAYYAVIWSPSGVIRKLGTLSADQLYSGADAINDAGQVVGWSGLSDARNAFVWSQATGMQGLGGLGGQSEAVGINGIGQIVGYSYDASGIRHGVLWTPVPEPSSLFAMLCGVAGMGAMLRNRNRRHR